MQNVAADHDGQPVEGTLVAANGECIEQRLGRMLVRAVARVDHRALDLLREQFHGAGGVVADHDQIRVHGVQRRRGIEQGLALAHCGGATDMFMTSAPRRLPASSKLAWVRVEDSKKRLISVRPRSVVRFFSIWRLSSTNSSERSRRPEISLGGKPFYAEQVSSAQHEGGSRRSIHPESDCLDGSGRYGKRSGAAHASFPGSIQRAIPSGLTMATQMFATHEVLNQTPPIGDVDLWDSDAALMGAIRAFGQAPKAEIDRLAAFGKAWGTAEMAELGRLANENPPKLKTFDTRGNRADIVEFHPAYHTLMREAIAAGIHSSIWGVDGGPAGPGAYVARAALVHMEAEVEQGHQCPIVMTNAATAALRAEPTLMKEWLPRIRSREYDARFLPAREKKGVTLGMGMTEKQGGSDVRANTSRAEPDGDAYRLVGHKWFFSAPMCDAFLVLAQAKGGLTCFLVPRFRPDGSVNALKLNRLKDKLGNRSNASSEVEFEGAYAARCGAEGEGVKTIIAMVQLTRLDCVVGSLGIMRAALMTTIHHVRHRVAFQKKLIDQPLMRAVIGDLALEREAALASVSGSQPHSTRRRRTKMRRPSRGSSRRWRSSGFARLCRSSCTSRSSASAATATWRRGRSRGSIVRRRSMRSGRGLATSWRSIFCAGPPARRKACSV